MRTGQAPINGGRWMLAQGGEETWIGRALAPRFWTILDSIYARARVNVNLELSRSGKPCQERISATGWARGSGQFAESAFDTLYVARNGG